MRLISGFVVREIAGETIAIPSGASAHQLSGLVSLNASGKLLFQLLQSECTEAQLVQAMMDTYDVDMATAENDVSEFLSILRHDNLLEE